MAASSSLLCAPFYDEKAQAYGYRAREGSVGIEAVLAIAEPFNARGIVAVMDAPPLTHASPG